MKFINYKENHDIRGDIESLYVSAFPSEERPPVEMFFETVKLENDQLFGFYNKSEFVGFANIITYKDIAYLFFLAVSPYMCF